MAQSPSPTVTSFSHVSKPDSTHSISPNNYSRFNRHLPLQQSISSASQMPTSPPSGSFSPHIVSNKYIEQFRSFVQHLRQVHDEETALWHLERAELDARVARLEATVRQYKARYGSMILSPLELPNQTPGMMGSFLTNDKPRSMSASTGDEFWRGAGGKIDAQPSRTFSESSDASVSNYDRRMPSIAENEHIRSHSSSRKYSESIPRSITRLNMDKNLDGITFKSNVLAPSVSTNLMTPQSPSPRHSPSPTRPSPGPISLPATGLLSAKDFYTKDAGHTPLARHSHPSNGTANISLSNLPTPTCPEDPSNKPRPSIAPTGQPAERSESYFPLIASTNPDDDQDPDQDLDPSLEAPLSLQNNSSDASFLSELDTKLLQAARSTVIEPSSSLPDIDEADSEGLVRIKENTKPEDKELEAEETAVEPKLRIKRSMNFGSQLGTLRGGKEII